MLSRLRRRIIVLFRFLFWSLPVFVVWTLPVFIVWRGPRGAVSLSLRGLRWCLRLVWGYCVCAPARLMRASPFATYRLLARKRDWVVGRVEYAHTESAKWRGCWRIAKFPYSTLRYFGVSPQIAVGLLAVGSTAGSAVIVNETVFAEKSFSRGDSGVYAAPADVPVVYSDANNTLRIDLGTVPVGMIEISSVTVGTAFQGSALPSGETSVVIIGGVATSTGFTGTWLEVSHLIIDRWRCDQMLVSNVEAHTLNIIGNASDGQSVSPSPSASNRRRGIGGGMRAENMTVSNSTYDQIRIQPITSGVNGQIDVLKLSNIYTKGGLCKIDRVRADVVDILLNEVGKGNGFSLKDFTISTSTTYQVGNLSDNVEVAISPP
jgi:hypothetical protein